eukprot:1888583-Amphidinium_carterae.1
MRDFVHEPLRFAAIPDYSHLTCAQQGPALALQLRGETCEVSRDLDAGELVNRRVDPLSGNALTGKEVPLHELHIRFGPMPQSRDIESVEISMTFKRKSGESSDSMIVRFEEIYRRANREGGVVLNTVAMIYLLIQVMGVKTDELLVLQNDFNRALLSNEARGSTMRNKRGTDKAQKSGTTRKKTKQLIGTTKKNTHTHTLRPSRRGNNDSARRVRNIFGLPRRTTRVENLKRKRQKLLTFRAKGQRKRKTQNPILRKRKTTVRSLKSSRSRWPTIQVQHLRFSTSSPNEVSERKGKQKGNPTPMGKDQSTSTALPAWTSWAVWSAMKGNVQKPRLMQQNVEGIIPDTGAITSLCGKEWSHRVERLLQRRPTHPL